MKPHRILKSFPGSQTGNDYHYFEAGTEAHLSDDLARIVVKEGWAEPVKTMPPEIANRETKVFSPEETKDEAPEQPRRGRRR